MFSNEVVTILKIILKIEQTKHPEVIRIIETKTKHALGLEISRRYGRIYMKMDEELKYTIDYYCDMLYLSYNGSQLLQLKMKSESSGGKQVNGVYIMIFMFSSDVSVNVKGPC